MLVLWFLNYCRVEMELAAAKGPPAKRMKSCADLKHTVVCVCVCV